MSSAAASIDEILNPTSVALIGASRNPRSWGNRMARVLVERFQGEVYLVNPSGAPILDRPAYARVSEIGAPVDLAVVAVASDMVLEAIEDCARAGVKGAVVIAPRPAGSGERGFDEKVLALARSGGMRIIGPNCTGIDNPAIGLNTWGALRPSRTGDVAVITQSGGIGDHALRQLRARGMGVSYYVSVGNETDIAIHEYLRFVRDDPATRVVALYMEGVKDGPRFLEEASRTAQVKPVVLLKAGRTETGARATASHTGALAGNGVVSAAAFRQAGIITVNDDTELMDVVEALASAPAPKGNRVAIVTEGGGHGSTAADLVDVNGLEAPPVSEAVQARLREILVRQPLATVSNPIDVPGMSTDPRVLAPVVQCLIDSGEFDGVVVVGEFGDYASFWDEARPDLAGDEVEAARLLGGIPERTGVPVILHSIFAGESPPALEALREAGLPVYDSIGRAMRCMGALRQAVQIRESGSRFARNVSEPAVPVVRELLARARAQNRDRLTDVEAMSLLADCGLRVPGTARARTPDEAAAMASRLGYPVVMKVDSPDIVHKSDAGGVVVGLSDEAEVRSAFARILEGAKAYDPRARVSGVAIYEMAREGTEVIIGALRDPQFGPVVMLGLGGVYVEILSDVVFRVAPVSREEAARMMRELNGYPILAGARGGKRRDMEAVIDAIVAVSNILISEESISEMDLNPVIAHTAGATIVDARISLNGKHGDTTSR